MFALLEMETVAGSPGYKKQFSWQGNAVHHSKPGLLGCALAEQAAGGSCYRGVKMEVSGGEGLFTFWRNESAFCFSWFLSVERNKSVCAVCLVPLVALQVLGALTWADHPSSAFAPVLKCP